MDVIYQNLTRTIAISLEQELRVTQGLMISGQDMFLVLDQTLTIKIVMQNPAFGALAPALQGQNYYFWLAILIHIFSSYIHFAESSKHPLGVC